MFEGILPKSYFITATDTDVGKTFVTVMLAKHFLNLGYSVGVMKPYSSGGRDDALLLKEELELGDDLDLINPVWFSEPLAPYACLISEVSVSQGNKSHTDIGLQAQVESGLQKIVLAYQLLTAKYDIVLVEGVGGVLVPLGDDYMLVDLIVEMNLPAILIGRAGLGTLNHTLLSIEAIRHRQVELAGVVMNGFKRNDESELSNKRIIEKFGKTLVFSEVPYIDNI